MEPYPPAAAAVPLEGSADSSKDGEGPFVPVDQFLVEALQNPRHRLTVLRMELDIQRFMRNPDQQQFEFQHFPTSYLRAAAHRVAQHYGLQTMVSDIMLDGSGRILVRKTQECRFPPVILSDIPAKQSENDKPEQVKIVLRPRPSKSSQSDAGELGSKQNLVRTMEERKEDYDRARARIFNGSSSPKSEGSPSHSVADGRNLCSSVDEGDCQRNSDEEFEKNVAKEGACTVAIFRDREKDRTDPDYDRSYGRYLRSTGPNQSFNLSPYGAVQPPFVQYDVGLHHLQQMSRTQPSVGFRVSDHALNPPNPYSSIGCNHNSRDAVYMQWPSPSLMYAHSYEHIRHSAFQVPFYPPPLSFGNSQNR